MHARSALFILLLCLLLTTTAAAQPEDQTFEGELTTRNTSASFDLELEAGQFVNIFTTSEEGLDTVLAINDPSGTEIARNDDEASGVLTSRVSFAPPMDGTYTAVVTGFSGATGEFSLTLTYGLDLGLSSEATTLLETQVSLSSNVTEEKFNINLEAGDIVVISTQAITTDLDTTLALTNAGGTMLAQNDDRGDGSFNSQISFEVVEGGSYTVIVSSYNSEGEGDLLLNVSTDPNAEPPFNFTSLQGDPIADYTGTLDDDQPSLEFPIELSAGQTVFALSNATSGDLDTVLTLNDPDGFPVANNDDRGDGTLNSAFAYTASTTGTYTVLIERFSRSSTTGDFELNISSVDSSVVDTLTAMLENTVTLSGPEQIIETTNFRVYYTLEGSDATTLDYAQEVADTLEEIYDIQVNQIGWAEPVRSDDGFYHAYVADSLSTGAMGYAKGVITVFDNPETADIRETRATRAVFVIDNDFAGMDSDASVQSLMRATVTHEFNHVIQYGYDSQEGLNWLYESTATWTETTTVGDDQDATRYTETDFQYPELCWTSAEDDGYIDYGQWTLLQSLADQYGERFVVQIWENSVEYDGFETMERTLDTVDATIPEIVERWRVQNFARDYDLAPLFPSTVWLENTIDDTGEWTFTGAGIQELAANYFALDLNGSYQFALDGEETLALIALGVADGEVQSIRLGREGIFDPTGYDYAALMVYNSAMPSEPGDCSYIDYSINVTEANGRMSQPAYNFSAENFEPLG